ncbi:MAG: hypothetical protein ACRENP_06025 [Longimicrobiales bacterium]
MKRLHVLIPLMAAVAACSSATEAPLSMDPDDAVVASEVGQTFELRVGQTARVGSGGLLIGFRGVEGDSRCPVDVTCVWAGDAKLRVPVTIGRMAWTSLELHTNLDPRSARFRDHTITVVGLRPDPRSNRPIPNDTYIVTLRVEQ